VAVLVLDAQYLSTWKSSQVYLYNLGVQLYSAGDRPCEPAELSDPIGNKCQDVAKAIKAFNTSMLVYLSQHSSPDWVQNNVLPPPSTYAAIQAEIHEATLWELAQKPDEAVKALKRAIMLGEMPVKTDEFSPRQREELMAT